MFFRDMNNLNDSGIWKFLLQSSDNDDELENSNSERPTLPSSVFSVTQADSDGLTSPGTSKFTRPSQDHVESDNNTLDSDSDVDVPKPGFTKLVYNIVGVPSTSTGPRPTCAHRKKPNSVPAAFIDFDDLFDEGEYGMRAFGW